MLRFFASSFLLILVYSHSYSQLYDSVTSSPSYTRGVQSFSPFSFGNKGYYIVELEPYIDHNLEMWESDGTTAGTRKMNVGSIGLNYYRGILGKTESHIFLDLDGIRSFDGNNFTSLNKPFTTSASPAYTTYSGSNKLFMIAQKSVSEYKFQLWESDGTSAGTTEIAADIDEKFLIVRDDYAYFLRKFSSSFYALYRYKDGVTESIKSFETSEDIHVINRTSSFIYFSIGKELWKSNGSPEGTVRISTDHPVIFSHVYNDKLITFNNRIWSIDENGEFNVISETFRRSGYWDGIVAGHKIILPEGVVDLEAKTYREFIDESYYFISLNYYENGTPGKILHTKLAEDCGTTLFEMDIESETSKPIHTVPFTGRNSPINSEISVGDMSLVLINDGVHGAELWKVEGETVEFVADINQSPVENRITDVKVSNNRIFFINGMISYSDIFIDSYQVYSWKKDEGVLTAHLNLCDDEYRSAVLFKGDYYFTNNGAVWRISDNTGLTEKINTPIPDQIVLLKATEDRLFLTTTNELFEWNNWYTEDANTFSEFRLDDRKVDPASGIEYKGDTYYVYALQNGCGVWKTTRENPGGARVGELISNEPFQTRLYPNDGGAVVMTDNGAAKTLHFISGSPSKQLISTFDYLQVYSGKNNIYYTVAGLVGVDLFRYNVSMEQPELIEHWDNGVDVLVIHESDQQVYVSVEGALTKIDLTSGDQHVIGLTPTLDYLVQVEEYGDRIVFSASTEDGLAGLYILHFDPDGLVEIASGLLDLPWMENFFTFDSRVYFTHYFRGNTIYSTMDVSMITSADMPLSEGTGIAYPNPTRGQIQITDDEAGVNVEVFDSQGRYLRKIMHCKSVDLSGNAPGMYFLKIHDSSNHRRVVKVIKT